MFLVLPFAIRCLGCLVLMFCLDGITMAQEETSDKAETLLCEKGHHRDRLPRIQSHEWHRKFHPDRTEPK